MQAEDYIVLFKEIVNKVNTQNKEVAALVILQEVSKDRRMNEIKGERVIEPATEKQKVFAKKLGLNLPNHIAKGDAALRINDALTINGKH